MRFTKVYVTTEEVNGLAAGTWLDRHPEDTSFFRVSCAAGEYFYVPMTKVKYDHTIDHGTNETYKTPPMDTQSPKGIKDDSGKTQWWYMDNFWPDLEQVADVLTYGDSKYPADDGANWKRLDNPEQRLCDALLRHVLKYRHESKDDPETGKSHLAHAITNALMLMYFDRNKKGKENVK